MKIRSTPLDGLCVAETTPRADARGKFARFFCARELAEILGSKQIVQINHSQTLAAGAIRGMHFQREPLAEMKLVRCLAGRAWDVAVDLRPESPTYLRWHAEELTAENGRMIIIPENFAHGFQALEPKTELLYLHTEYYAPGSEGGLRYDDPALSIEWPLNVAELSERDAGHPFIRTDLGKSQQ